MGKAAVTTTRRAAIAKAAKTAPPGSAPGPEPPVQFVEMKRKKKKGRPSLLDLQKRQQQQQRHLLQQQQKTLTPSPASPPNPPIHNSTPARRSTRRNPSNYDSPSSDFFNDDEDDDDDDDERQQKKVKLVVRLPQSTHFLNSSSQNSAASASDSGADDPEDHQTSPGKPMINAVDLRSNDVVFDQVGKGLKATDSVHGSGSSLDAGPTTPLPDKKMLVFVLDRLQKKDTYGVFSEPVDPNELPDYHEIIEHPMDFGTLRKKLDAGCYRNLEELEADVLLICSNAMQYNAPDTIYFRQARSIHELAKRDFENLRNEGDNGEPQPKVVRRGRPPSKNLKKPLESTPVDRVSNELSSGATLASAEDTTIGSNGYNLRKGSAVYRFRSNDGFGTSNRSRSESFSDWLVDWNSEFPASILRQDMKYGKKHFSAVDENRRDTYKQNDPSTSSSDESYSRNAFGDLKQLLPVGLQLEPHAYARSLARYAANLGPVAWSVASRKLKSALPDGLAFGPGWVEENDAPQQLLVSAEKPKQTNGVVHERSRPVTPSSSVSRPAVTHGPSPELAEAVRRLNCQNDLAGQAGRSAWATTGGSIFQAQQHKSLFHPNRNGLNGMFGFDLPSQVGLARQTIQAGLPGLQECSTSDRVLCISSAGDASSSLHTAYRGSSEGIKLSENRSSTSRSAKLLGHASDSNVVVVSEVGMSGPQFLLAEQQRQEAALAVPPDLNVRVQTSASPSSSSLQIGSPQQPDLALQL